MRPHLATLLDDFRRFGNQIAIARHVGVRRRVRSYGAIARLAGRFAALLVERKMAAGDRVVIWGENGAQWVAAFYGCMLRGVIAVPLDVYGTPEFAARVAADVRPALIVGHATLLAGLPDEWPKLAFEGWAVFLPQNEAGPVDGLSHETPLQILFTSGTTGEPKGIVHTHGNVLSSIEPIERAAQAYMKYERLVHPLRFLHTLPLSHVFGQTMGLWMPPIFAAEVHFENRLTASRLIETTRRERISVIAAVPRILAMLKVHLEVEFPDLTRRIEAPQGISAAQRWWRFRDIHREFGFKFWAFITGGGALPASVEQFWNALGFVLVQGYGMTETAALITLNHPFKVARGTLGKPLPGREVKLGTDGEVLVRGPMISPATWSAGALHRRCEEWLATGDLAQADPTGELRFIGRKSETIVTSAGVNIHPEDIEFVIEQEPEVTGCAVVPVYTPLGAEALAVLAIRGSSDSAERAAGAVVQRANTRLAEFQRIRRWVIWPEPDLPRTSTGKVRRAVVTAWVRDREGHPAGPKSGPSTDWLSALIASIAGEQVQAGPSGGDDLRLSEDLRLDSLGRVQLLEALEQRLGIALDQDEYDRVETLGGLRQLVSRAEKFGASQLPATHAATGAGSELEVKAKSAIPKAVQESASGSTRETLRYVYPRWPWWRLFRALRTVFVELAMRPLVWGLAAPQVVRSGAIEALTEPLTRDGPMLIVANHVTSFDVPLLLYALPRAVRDRTAVAMSGEMLEDFRHARNLHPGWLNPLGPAAWLLVTAFFNVFPLPRRRDFQRSFAHAGRALDRGFHVVIFPEGTRSAEGRLANFRPGIGLLVKQANAPVLPMALVGLGSLKAEGKGWFRSGKIEVRVGAPIQFAATDLEAAITSRLHSEVQALLGVQPR